MQEDLAIQRQWFINGRHYSLTLEAWLAKQDAQRKAIRPIMEVGGKLRKPSYNGIHVPGCIS